MKILIIFTIVFSGIFISCSSTKNKSQTKQISFTDIASNLGEPLFVFKISKKQLENKIKIEEYNYLSSKIEEIYNSTDMLGIDLAKDVIAAGFGTNGKRVELLISYNLNEKSDYDKEKLTNGLDKEEEINGYEIYKISATGTFVLLNQNSILFYRKLTPDNSREDIARLTEILTTNRNECSSKIKKIIKKENDYSLVVDTKKIVNAFPDGFSEMFFGDKEGYYHKLMADLQIEMTLDFNDGEIISNINYHSNYIEKIDLFKDKPIEKEFLRQLSTNENISYLAANLKIENLVNFIKSDDFSVNQNIKNSKSFNDFIKWAEYMNGGFLLSFNYDQENLDSLIADREYIPSDKVMRHQLVYNTNNADKINEMIAEEDSTYSNKFFNVANGNYAIISKSYNNYKSFLESGFINEENKFHNNLNTPINLFWNFNSMYNMIYQIDSDKEGNDVIKMFDELKVEATKTSISTKLSFDNKKENSLQQIFDLIEQNRDKEPKREYNYSEIDNF